MSGRKTVERARELVVAGGKAMNAFFFVVLAWGVGILAAIHGSYVHALELGLLGALVLAGAFAVAGIQALKKRDDAEAERDEKPKRVEHDLAPEAKEFAEQFLEAVARPEIGRGES